MKQPRPPMPELAIAPALRPWHAAGFTLLLASPERLARHAAPAQPASRPLPPPAAPAPTAAERPSPSTAPLSSAPAQPASSPGACAPFPSELYEGLAPDAWPPFFRERWQKQPSTAPIVWSYWELAYDLSGCASRERRDVLRALNGALRLPPRTSVYWPLNQPATPPDDASRLEAAPLVFLAAVRRLRARFVVIFGERAFSVLQTGCAYVPFTVRPRYDALFYFLPGIAALADDTRLRDKAAAFLAPHFACLATPQER